MSARDSSRNYLPMIAATAVILALVIGAVLWLRSYLGAEVQPQKQVVQEVRILRPPPPPETPPPPPPPPEEEVDVPDPQQPPDPVASNEPPAGNDLGVDAEGSGSGDSFGLVGKPGGRDLLATGGNGAALSIYALAIKDAIQQRLNDDPGIRSGSYTVRVRLWVRNGDEVERANLVGSSGDKDRDRAIERVLSQLTRLPQTIPPNTPQPINVRIVSRA